MLSEVRELEEVLGVPKVSFQDLPEDPKERGLFIRQYLIALRNANNLITTNKKEEENHV